jgi:hypothetical protein
MNGQEMERLVRKYYGYVADLEGSGVEALDLLFVRDKIQQLLDASGPEEQIPTPLFEQIHDLDQALWAESETFCVVVGERELQQARRQQRSPRSHWWWYLDELKATPQPGPKSRSHIAPVLVPA